MLAVWENLSFWLISPSRFDNLCFRLVYLFTVDCTQFSTRRHHCMIVALVALPRRRFRAENSFSFLARSDVASDVCFLGWTVKIPGLMRLRNAASSTFLALITEA